jgi:hypothetical protein
MKAEKVKKLPRGIRNCNPGNLVISKIPWNGKVPKKDNTDGHFEQFISMEYGIRAMIMDLRGDIMKDGLDTIEKLIRVYAPKFENNTEAYIKVVVKRTGIKRNEKLITDKSTIFKLVEAISFHENGGSYITNEQIEKAWEMLSV